MIRKEIKKGLHIRFDQECCPITFDSIEEVCRNLDISPDKVTLVIGGILQSYHGMRFLCIDDVGCVVPADYALVNENDEEIDEEIAFHIGFTREEYVELLQLSGEAGVSVSRYIMECLGLDRKGDDIDG